MTAVLFNRVPAQRAGTASGVFNTSRQIGGALAVAVFGALLTKLNRATFIQGLRLAAGVALAAAASLLLKPPRRSHGEPVEPAGRPAGEASGSGHSGIDSRQGTGALRVVDCRGTRQDRCG